MTARRLCVVVLAGGASRRFGSDKLDAQLAGRPLLEHVVAGIGAATPAGADLIVVGPERPLPMPAVFVRENPPGGGPAAALVTGLEAALRTEAARIVVAPGDSPAAGAGAATLLAALDRARAEVVVGTDSAGREQPLQLALTRSGAEALLRAAGDGRGHGASARALLARTTPAPLRHRIDEEAHADVDVPGDLDAWADRLRPS
jgi:molybdopterin-guanine dinucleotide biosynthesis protein A